MCFFTKPSSSFLPVNRKKFGTNYVILGVQANFMSQGEKIRSHTLTMSMSLSHNYEYSVLCNFLLTLHTLDLFFVEVENHGHRHSKWLKLTRSDNRDTTKKVTREASELWMSSKP